MKPYEVITYKDKKIIILDISDTSPEQAIAYFKDAQPKIARFSPKSALVLTIATNARFNTESSAAIKAFVADNTPYVKASASVGTQGLQRVVHNAIERQASRTIHMFDTREEALDWLVSQE